MNAFARDVRFALRVLLRNRASTVASVISLCLGIASVTLAFSVTNAILLRPIPGVEPEGLVRVVGAGVPEGLQVLSWSEYVALQRVPAFDALAAERINSTAVGIAGRPRTLGAAVVSSGYFQALGTLLARGTTFEGASQDSRIAPSVIIAYGLWESAFASDPEALGETVRVGGVDFVISGVAPPGFSGTFPGFHAQMWFPIEYLDVVFPADGSISVMEDRFLNVVARTAPGTDEEVLAAQLEAVAAALGAVEGFPEGRTFRLESARGVHPALRGVASAILGGLMTIGLLVLAVACSNVANMALARGVERKPELAIRSSLGGSRRRLVAQLLIEACLLGLTGAGCALLLSVLGARALSAAPPPPGVPFHFDIIVDKTVLVFASLVGVTSGVAFGLIPAWRSITGALEAAGPLRAAGHRSAGLLRGTLVLLQVSCTTVLLIVAGLLLRSVANTASLDPGFDRAHVVTVSASAEALEESDGRAFWNRLVELVRTQPDVASVELSLFVHLGGRSDRLPLAPEGEDPAESGLPTHYSIVGPDFFQVLGIDVRTGRAFAVDEPPGSVVVNEALARRLWPETDPLGRRLEAVVFGEPRTLVVVGVVETVKVRRFNEPPTPFLYLPLRHWYRPDLVVHARTSRRAALAAPELRDRLAGFDPDVPTTVGTMEDHDTVEVTLARGLRVILLICGLVTLAIAAAGVFGVVSYSVSRRAPEIAIRLALGGTPRRMLRLVLGRKARLLASGLAVGAILAYPAAGVLRVFLYGIEPFDPGTFAVACAVILSVGMASAVGAASGGIRVEPAATLRGE
jgi:putative ABC transport system permease protein